MFKLGQIFKRKQADESRRMEPRESPADGSSSFRPRNQVQADKMGKIFTIATVLVVVCLPEANLLASAQQQQPQQQQHLSPAAGRSQVVPPMGRQQAPRASEERHDERGQKSASIDRFDSGEQIRAPLLRQPTTLAPLAGDKQQAGAMQPAASSQEAFMSPEERDQLLKQQESHYEGRSAQDSEQRESQRPWRPQQGPAEPGKLQSEASNAASSNEADEGDYEDEGSEPTSSSGNKPPRANLVPDNRRQSADGGLRRSSRPASRPLAANSVDAGEPGQDYEGANDDAYFSRKASAEPKRPQARPNQAEAGGGDRRSSGPNRRAGPRGSAYGAESHTEADGFGPGPNEAYMADRAESGGRDPEDEGSQAGAENEPGAGPQASDDELRFDRRSMDGHGGPQAEPGANAKVRPATGYVRPINYEEGASPFGDQSNGGAGEEAEADEGPDADSAQDESAFAPSSRQPAASNSLSSAARKASDPLPVAADSRPVAASTGSQAAANEPRRPGSTAHNKHQQTSPSSNQLAQSQAMRTIPAPALVQPITGATTSSSLMNQQQRPQLRPPGQAPYNPQTNPSHAGKYFIN